MTESLPVNLFLDQIGTFDNSSYPHFIENNNIYRHIKCEGGKGDAQIFNFLRMFIFTFTDALPLPYCNIVGIYIKHDRN